MYWMGMIIRLEMSPQKITAFRFILLDRPLLWISIYSDVVVEKIIIKIKNWADEHGQLY